MKQNVEIRCEKLYGRVKTIRIQDKSTSLLLPIVVALLSSLSCCLVMSLFHLTSLDTVVILNLFHQYYYYYFLMFVCGTKLNCSSSFSCNVSFYYVCCCSHSIHDDVFLFVLLLLLFELSSVALSV
jgi:hypothetical protein